MNLKRREAMNNVIKWVYNKDTESWWDNAEKKAYAFMKFNPDSNEAVEIECVKDILGV
jgi:hypothetical protein